MTVHYVLSEVVLLIWCRSGAIVFMYVLVLVRWMVWICLGVFGQDAQRSTCEVHLLIERHHKSSCTHGRN